MTDAALLRRSARPPTCTVGGGFSDPVDRNGAVTWKVGDKHVRA